MLIGWCDASFLLVHWVMGRQKQYICLGFEVFTAVVMKSTIFWDITRCSLLNANRRFRGTYCLHLQCRRISHARNHRESRWQAELSLSPAYSSTLKMEAICSSEKSVDIQGTAWRYIPEDGTVQLVHLFAMKA
jgi:hypothetical protein